MQMNCLLDIMIMVYGFLTVEKNLELNLNLGKHSYIEIHLKITKFLKT